MEDCIVLVDIENSGNYVAFSPKFSNGQSSRTKFLNASRIKIRILDVLKTSNTINRIVHNGFFKLVKKDYQRIVKLKHEKVYKDFVHRMIRIFPSDPLGSLDDFFLSIYRGLSYLSLP